MLSKEFLIVSTGQFIGLITSFLFIKLLSHIIPVNEYGIYSLALSAASLFALLPFSSFDQAISRFLVDYEQKLLSYYTHVLFMYGIFIIIIFIPITVLLFFSNLAIFEEVKSIAGPLLIFSILNIVRNLLLNVENFRRNRVIVTFSKIYEGIMKIIFIFFLSFILNISAAIILIVINVIYFFNIVFLLYSNKTIISLTAFSHYALFEIIKKCFTFSAPLLIWTLFSWFTSNSAIWILQNNFQTEVVGHFSMINNLAGLLPIQLIAILSAFFSPIYYQKEVLEPGHTRQSIKKVTKLLIMIFLFFGILLYQYAENYILIVSNSQYLEYSWLMIYMYINSVIISITQFLAIEIFVYKEPKRLIVANIVPSLIMVSAFIIVPVYGIHGLLFIMLISSISYLLIVYTQVNRIRKKQQLQQEKA